MDKFGRIDVQIHNLNPEVALHSMLLTLSPEDFKCFGGKLMRKLEEKVLKKNWKNWTAHLARNPGLAGKLRLSVKKATRKPKGWMEGGVTVENSKNAHVLFSCCYFL
ncbi:hypothetical protein JHK87_022640 [Glycine soja]|nr:hypothetical protein JHK87_022640 [Glycine soja]